MRSIECWSRLIDARNARADLPPPAPAHTQRERELESLAAENAHIQRQIDAAKSLREGLLMEHRRVMKAVRDVVDAGTRAHR